MEVQGLIDDVIGLVVPDDPGGLASLTKDLITLRNATEATLAVCAARIDRLGLAKKAGSTTSKWLQDNGAAPVSASRWIRLGTGLARLDRTAGYFRDGFLSTEHVDAIVKGVRQISGRSAEAVTDEKRLEFERKLLSHAMSGAPPTEPVSEDGAARDAVRNEGAQRLRDEGRARVKAPSRANNQTQDYAFVEGRLVGRFDVDKQIGEKLFSALDAWSKPRPEPDGSDDVRSPTQRRADALHQLLDCGGGGGDGLVSGPRTEVNVSVPADHPERASLEWMGPITEALAKMLACDSSMASVILDSQGVPIDISASKRLFTGKTRKAIIIRDESVSAGWAARDAVRNEGAQRPRDEGRARIEAHPQRTIDTAWEITMGSDGHPWLIPPADVDPLRRPLPAYNRRTMTLAA